MYPRATGAPDPHIVEFPAYIVGLLFYVVTTSKVISGWIATCDGALSQIPFSSVTLGNQAVSTMTVYYTPNQFLPYYNIAKHQIMPNTRLGSNIHNFCKSLV